MLKLLSRLGGLADNTLPALVCVLAFVAGYVHGTDTAEKEGKARIAALQAAWAEQERARAEAAAAAEKNARERLAAETARGEKFARELAVKTAELDAERASINRRIRDVSEKARRDCAGLSLEWVRLYNEALGLAGSYHSAGNEGSAPGGAHGASGLPGTAGTRLQPDPLATPEDVLAHVRDYGLYCRKLEAGYRALITFYNDGGSRGRHTD